MDNFEERLDRILKEKNVKSVTFGITKGNVITCTLINASNNEDFVRTGYTLVEALNKAFELYEEDERMARDHY